MLDNDTPLEGPLSIDDALDMAAEREDATTEAEESETLETEAEEVEAEEVEADEAEDETDEQDEPEADDAEPEVYDVSEYGEIAIQLSDGTQTTLAELEKGNLRQADYTRKNQARSEREKQIEAAEQALAERERQLNEQFASLEEQEPDWEKLAEEDPLGLPLAQINWQKKQKQKAEARAQAEQAEAQARTHFQQQTAALAVQVMPEWASGEAFQSTAKDRRQAALNAGFTEQEYQGANDFRLAVLLEKAARYDAGQTKVKSATKKLSKVPKVVKPGTSVSKAEKEQASRVAKSKRLNRPMGIQEYLDAKLSD